MRKKEVGKFILNSKYRILLIIAIILYCLCGVPIIIRGNESYVKNEAGKTEIPLHHAIVQQKVLGNDRSLDRIILPIYKNSVSNYSEITVTIYKGNVNEEGIKIAETRVYIEDNNMIVDVPSVFLKWNRDYYIVIDGTSIKEGDFLYLQSGIKDDIAYTLYFAPVTGKALFLWKMILIIFPFTIAISILLNIDFWRALAISASLDCLILYVIGLFDRFLLITPIFLFISLTSIAFIVCKVLQNYKNELEIDLQYCWEITTFLLIYIFLFVLSQKLIVNSWDDMTQWATIVQEMWQFDKMPQHELYSGYNYRYPPVYSLYQLLFIYLNRAYDEHLLFWAKYVLETMFVLPCLSTIKVKRTGAYYLMAMIVICFLPLLTLGKSDLAYALYADVLFGVLTGYYYVSFSRAIKEKGKVEMLELAFATFMVTLVKEAGMISIVALWGACITIDIILPVIKRSKKAFNYLLPITISLVVFIVSKCSWSLFLKSRIDDIGEVAVDTQTGVSYLSLILKILKFFIGQGEIYQYETGRLYLRTLLVKGNYKFIIWNQSFCMLFLAGVLFFIIFMKYFNISLAESKRTIAIGVITSIYILIGYWMVYTFFLSSYEALKLASIDRYLGSYILGSFLWMFYEVLSKLDLANRPSLSIASIIVSLSIAISAGGFSTLQYALWNQSTIEYEKDDRLNFRRALNENAMVYYINAYDNGYDYITYMYLASPIRLNPIFSIDQEGKTIVSYVPRIHKQKDYERTMSYDEFILDVSKYDYVYICRADSKFRRDYGNAFADEIENKTIYKVNTENNVYLTKFKCIKEKGGI